MFELKSAFYFTAQLLLFALEQMPVKTNLPADSTRF